MNSQSRTDQASLEPRKPAENCSSVKMEAAEAAAVTAPEASAASSGAVSSEAETASAKPAIAVEMNSISKNFGDVHALDHVSIQLFEGEILSLLGENGSGKTTLMNVLFGIYFPDEGWISVKGQPVCIRNPRDAKDLGIGMVQQHVKLVDVLTVAENIVLGMPGKALLDRRAIAAEIKKTAERYGFKIDPDRKVYELSISEKQMVAIVKVLYHGADVLILDEPTAVLTPQEIQRLFAVLKKMKADGKSIIIITHKLHEVLEVSDRVTVLRKGQLIGTIPTSEASPYSLTEMMVGHKVNLEIERPLPHEVRDCLVVKNLTCLRDDGSTALNNVSFTARAGEILGVAGISGSGQKELCEAITGLFPAKEGSVRFLCEEGHDGEGLELLGLSPEVIMKKGISLAFVPEDRLGMGLVPSLSMVDNILLKKYHQQKGVLVNRKKPAEIAQNLIDQLEIVTPGVETPIRRLSGGNVQKVLVGREIECNPRLLIVAYPVRGLDINSSYTIYNLLNQQKAKGVAVIFIGEDLDVLMEISDRLLVLSNACVSGIVDPRTKTKEEIGLLMVQGGDESFKKGGQTS